MYTKEYFSDKLQELVEGKKDKDYKNTITKQAAEMGIPYQTFLKYVNGVCECPACNIEKIAKYYKVSADYLLGLTKNSTFDRNLDIVYDYTGLSNAALKKIVHKRNNRLVSQIIESNEFWDIVQNINSALINFDTLYPSGKINAESAAAQMGTKINWNDNNKNVDLSKFPTEYQKYLGVVSEQGTKPLYKHLLTEIISRLFDNIINDKMKR